MIIVETFLICDGACGTNYGVDMRHLTGSQHRQNAKKEGWKVYDGKDYCPDCVRILPPRKKEKK